MRIAVIGGGGMGRWFARRFVPKREVAVYDIQPEKKRILREIHPLGHLSELGDFTPDILLNAVDIRNTIGVFRSATPHLKGDCILADIASIKGELPRYYQDCGFPYLSFHPMFGPGFNHGQQRRENVIIISESDERAKRFLIDFFQEYPVTIHELPFSRHDAQMAHSLTLPFASSIVFAACMKGGQVPGTTFARHEGMAARLLREDDHLLSEILFNPHSVKQLDRIGSRLQFLKHIIMGRDYPEVRRFLGQLRENLEKRKGF